MNKETANKNDDTAKNNENVQKDNDAVAEKKAYMPSEQAGVVMSENAEVKNLITDLGLDIK